jgi:hypothetical protein
MGEEFLMYQSKEWEEGNGWTWEESGSALGGCWVREIPKTGLLEKLYVALGFTAWLDRLGVKPPAQVVAFAAEKFREGRVVIVVSKEGEKSVTFV